MKVVIIGSGNAASVLARKIYQAGHPIVQVVSRNLEEAHALGSLVNSPVVYNTRYLDANADLYLIAVSDTYLQPLAAALKLNNRLVVHTAAAVSMDVLSESSENYGVLYPLQTLHKGNTELPAIPILADANNEKTKATLIDFATSWADSVTVATDSERLKLHIAAMFANNFSNHLFAVAAQYCKSEHLKSTILQPLINETAKAIRGTNPALVQTGPAVRKDFATIEKHLHLLKDYPHIKKLYEMMNDSILQFYKAGNVAEK